jgi:protein-L-isoaspartate(D-aspartate) O-methyltransferase
MSLNAEAARQQMVTQQVRAWEVLDPAVLRVLSEVSRERFVPAAYASLAFADTAIPLPQGQHMLTPHLAGRILQALQIGPSDHVLEVGTGSGFLTACLGRLARRVTSLEISPELADMARRNLAEAGATNCQVIAEDVFRWQPDGSFNCIAVTGSIPVFDHRFQDWLAPSGRLFLPVGQAPVMEAWLVRRAEGEFTRESLFETALPALRNAPQPEPFRF